MANSWNKFSLLLWKNWIIQKRHYIQTLFEILIPALCCSMLILVRGLVDPELVTEPTTFAPLPIDMFPGIPITLPRPLPKVAYSPANPILDALVADALENHMLSTFTNFTHEGYPNAFQLQALLVQQNYFVGIEFDDALANITELPEQIGFALRFPGETRTNSWLFANWRTNYLVVPFSPGARNPNLTDGGTPNYYYEGFVTFQTALSSAIVAARNPTFSNSRMQLRVSCGFQLRLTKFC